MISLLKVIQVYISWTNTDVAPMRQLVGVKRISISNSKSANVSTQCTCTNLMKSPSQYYYCESMLIISRHLHTIMITIGSSTSGAP